MDPSSRAALSRRSLLRAAGVGAIGTAALSGGAIATGALAQTTGQSRGTGAIPLDPSSTTVLNVSCDEFLPVNMSASTAWDYMFWGGLQMNAASPGSYWHAGLHLPLGSMIKGLDLTVDPRNQSGGLFARIMRYRAIPGGPTGPGSPVPGTDSEIICETAVATGSGLVTVSSPAVSHTVDELNWNYRITFIYLAPGGAILFNARAGYTPPTTTTPPASTTTSTTTTTIPASTTTAPAPAAAPSPVFLATPVRVYDSRPGTPGTGPKTPLTPGAVRTVACGGPTIPSNVRGLICNLTATNTSGGGYAVLYPGGSAIPPTSSVNWTGAAATVANSAVVGCGSNATLSLVTAQASADLIVDVTGYYT